MCSNIETDSIKHFLGLVSRLSVSNIPQYFYFTCSPMLSLHIYTFVVSRAFMTGEDSQAGNADSSRAPGLTSGLQGSVNVHRGALLLVPQWQCISSFVFYIADENNSIFSFRDLCGLPYRVCWHPGRLL